MPRHRSRSRSRSPLRRKRYDEPRERLHDSRSPGSSGLLVRNISLSSRPEDLRVPFERFGPIKDVYLPKNYYTGEPRGFGFVKFRYPEDAADAKRHLDGAVIGGREIRIVFAEENRKTPQEMRRVTHVSSRRSTRRQSPSFSPRRRRHSYSRSPSSLRNDKRNSEKDTEAGAVKLGMTTLHANQGLCLDQFLPGMKGVTSHVKSPQDVPDPFPAPFLRVKRRNTGQSIVLQVLEKMANLLMYQTGHQVQGEVPLSLVLDPTVLAEGRSGLVMSILD